MAQAYGDVTILPYTQISVQCEGIERITFQRIIFKFIEFNPFVCSPNMSSVYGRDESHLITVRNLVEVNTVKVKCSLSIYELTLKPMP